MQKNSPLHQFYLGEKFAFCSTCQDKSCNCSWSYVFAVIDVIKTDSPST